MRARKLAPLLCGGLTMLVAISLVVWLPTRSLVTRAQKISAVSGKFSGHLDNHDNFGMATAGLGDLDGDGVTDAAVGAYRDDVAKFNGGALWILFLNADGTVREHEKLFDTEAEFPGSRFGVSVAALGDLDRDGVMDLAVGGHTDGHHGYRPGAVWILFLRSDGTTKKQQKITTNRGNFAGQLSHADRLGVALAGLGDINSDGTPDIAVGAHKDDAGGPERGALWVLFLNPDGTVDSHQKISDTDGNFEGVLRDGDHFGKSIATLGDVDGDGIQDLAVGAYRDDDGGSDRGAVWILFLKRDGTVKSAQKISAREGCFLGELRDGDLFGASVAPLGDLDLNGVPDVVVGAPLDNELGRKQGALWVLLLKHDGTVATHRKLVQRNVPGELADYGGFGSSVAALGDVDQDHNLDLAVGARLSDDGGPGRGAVWVLFGGFPATGQAPSPR